VTDASHMLGMTASMKREDYVPLAIAAGCDMFLFFNDIEANPLKFKSCFNKSVISSLDNDAGKMSSSCKLGFSYRSWL
jgi:beta-N-acetylhexosaminidase